MSRSGGRKDSVKNGRRRFLANSGKGLGTLILSNQFPGLVRAQGPAVTPANRLIAPSWESVPICAASSTDSAVQGPFFIHDGEVDDDISLFRQDLRGQYDPSAEPGIEMQLHLRILDATSGECSNSPVSGIAVYIWHCDAQGYYSGFGEPGEQNPDQPYRGRPGSNDLDNSDRYCRGAAITDENGVVSFRTIFPGWYNGRDIHIHFMALEANAGPGGRRWYSGDGHVFTTQLYFEPELIDRVHKVSQPYLRRTAHEAYQGAIQGDERGNSGLRARATFSEGMVVAQMQILLDPEESVTGRSPFSFRGNG